MSGRELAWTFPGGKLVRLYTAGAAVDKDLDIRPADGKIWLITKLFAWHDDTTSRTISWYLTDGTTENLETQQSAAVAANIPCAYGQVGSKYITPYPPHYISYDYYLVVKIDDLAAGKKLYFDGLALEMSE